MTLSSIVLTHILCNALRIFLGVLVVALVGGSQFRGKNIFFLPEEQVACMEEFDQYIPPLWVMCLESVAHLLVMINFSTNFIIYCSVSAPFKKAFSKVKLLILCMAFSSNIGHFHKNFLIVDMKYCLLSEYRCFSERENLLIFPFPNTVSLSRLHICGQ